MSVIFEILESERNTPAWEKTEAQAFGAGTGLNWEKATSRGVGVGIAGKLRNKKEVRKEVRIASRDFVITEEKEYLLARDRDMDMDGKERVGTARSIQAPPRDVSSLPLAICGGGGG